uniref:High affinity cgmp-specific 3-cyclic phosphodiesterase 9a n=1 Tax=Tetraselmis sp. GSL018 TaxID=582737 RepID=A0A061R9C6_9CHLO
MPPNGYHNAVHVADVVQLMYLQTGVGGPLELFCGDPIVRLSAILAAVVHDLAHPGFSNAFLTSVNHALVKEYGIVSTNEHMHIAVFQHLVSQQHLDFLSTLSSENKKRVFRYVDEMILSTDMSRHFQILQTEVSEQGEQHLVFLLCIALKVSDLSHTMRGFRQHAQFVGCLKDELYSQGDAEKAQGLEVGIGMDREEEIELIGDSQSGFLSFLLCRSSIGYAKYLAEVR